MKDVFLVDEATDPLVLWTRFIGTTLIGEW